MHAGRPDSHVSTVRGEECAATAMLAKCHTERVRLLNILHGRLNLWPRPLSSEVEESQPGTEPVSMGDWRGFSGDGQLFAWGNVWRRNGDSRYVHIRLI